MSTTDEHPLGQDRQACTGCAACAARCPRGCIDMSPDEEGFPHPRIRLDECTGCDLCREVCPIRTPRDKPAETGQPLEVWAAWHLDEAVRRESSSGGVFTALAEQVLAQGGLVAGAAFDENLVVRHILIDSPAELHRLRGSKYVQSEMMPELYRAMQDALEQGRAVLFSGTPCQVAGARRLLGSTAGLLCCDLVCHGVPSPRLLAGYLEHQRATGCRPTGLSFRDKSSGWKSPSVRLDMEDGSSRLAGMSDDPYTVAFLRDYSLRPACYACRFTCTSRGGDLTIADFWRVSSRYPQYDREDKGTSLILVNTPAGQSWLDACRNSLFLGAAELEAALGGNPMLYKPSHRPRQRDVFYHDLARLPFDGLIRRYRLHAPSRWRQTLAQGKRRIKRVLRRALRRNAQAQGKAP